METKTGTCHCGAVTFEVDLDNGLENLRRCNCSLCRRKGAIMMGVPETRIRIISGAEHLSMYQWNTRVAEHFFCSHCGIYTHHRRRSNPREFGINIGCLHGVDPLACTDVTVVDGGSLTVVGVGQSEEKEP
jgi:hypothetical protein